MECWGKVSHIIKMHAFFLVTGSSPSMADYLMWPWIERLYLITDLLKGFPVLSAWCAAMSEVPAVKKCTVPAEWHKKFYEGYKAKNPDAQLVGLE